ncbi:peptidylprolyl isomerase [Sphingomonas sp. 1P06PA]
MGRWTALAAAWAAAIGAAAAIAQTVDDGVGPTAAGLNLPAELTVFGKADPKVRKATAIVNGTIITDTDIDQRLALVAAANGGNIPAEERERLRLQILRNLIDEALQIQEARGHDITISPEEINQTFNRVAGNFKREPRAFGAYLKEIGSSEASMKRQIEGELAWRRLLSRRVEPFINVGQEEVEGVMARLNAAKGAQEYRIGEIFLSATPANDGEVRANADRIVDQVRKGASFVAYARQFSEASTAAVGGELGWVRAEQLPSQLAEVAQSMQPGTISQPVPLPGGYSIIAVIDKRQVLTADPRDAALNLKQVGIEFPKGTTQAQAGPRVEAFAKAMSEIQGCGKADEVAKSIGAEVVDNAEVRVRDLPAPLQAMMLELNVGQATRPFGSLDDGVRSLILCGRDDPQAANGPSFDQILARMEEERVNRRAQRYMRDLRRDAVVDYR